MVLVFRFCHFEQSQAFFFFFLPDIQLSSCCLQLHIIPYCCERGICPFINSNSCQENNLHKQKASILKKIIITGTVCVDIDAFELNNTSRKNSHKLILCHSYPLAIKINAKMISILSFLKNGIKSGLCRYVAESTKSTAQSLNLRTRCHILLAQDGGRQAAVSLLEDDTRSTPRRWDFSTPIHFHTAAHTHTCKQTHKQTRLPPNDREIRLYPGNLL